jgi:hypothetical protein
MDKLEAIGSPRPHDCSWSNAREMLASPEASKVGWHPKLIRM